MLISPNQQVFCEALPFDFNVSNNEAEYEALITSLQMAKEMKINHLIAYSDSQLVVNQVNNIYQAKEERMNNYLQLVKEKLKNFGHIQVEQILRTQNGHADALARLATSEGIERFDSIPVGRICHPAIEESKTVHMATDLKPTWMDKIILYLQTDACPEDLVMARKLRIRGQDTR